MKCVAYGGTLTFAEERRKLLPKMLLDDLDRSQKSICTTASALFML